MTLFRLTIATVAAIIVGILAAIVFPACRIVAPATLPSGDAATAPAVGSVVCQHLRSLGCPEGSPSPKGETCEALVLRVPYALPVQCIADAETVTEIRDCNVACYSGGL